MMEVTESENNQDLEVELHKRNSAPRPDEVKGDKGKTEHHASYLIYPSYPQSPHFAA